MLKQHKWKIILSSLVTLLPILYGLIMWDDLPDMLTTHWGADGIADGFGSKAFVVFGVSGILLALHLLCVLVTCLDKKQLRQNQKALGIVFWILPMVSLFANGITYQAAFGMEFDISLLMPGLFGLMFVVMGNYLPKITQNRTLGLKLPWTLNNEENWNKTHRFTGKLWVAGGLALLLCMLLPLSALIWAMIAVIATMVIVPTAYSYGIYKRHKKEGIVYTPVAPSRKEKVARRISAVLVPIILVGVAVLMFTGSITATCEDTSLKISTTYWSNSEVSYEEIDSIAYRTDFDPGVRTSGFGSAKLSLGIFQNAELGSYTLYAYTGAEEYILLTSGDKTLVIGLGDKAETQALYEALLGKIGK